MVTGANGNYSATIPGQSKNSRAQFYIEAIDTLGSDPFFKGRSKIKSHDSSDDGKSKLQRLSLSD